MAWTERLRPLFFCLLALLVYAALEIALFRTGAYFPIMSSDTNQGRVHFLVRYEKARASTGKKEVLLTGDSGIEFGFWTGLFERENPKSPVVFLMRSVPNSPLNFWYYALGQIDPRHDRYSAIVIPLHDYRIFPQIIDQANRYDVAQILAPLLPPSAYFDLVKTYTDPDLRYRAAVLGIFLNHDFSFDLQDFIVHPISRFRPEAQRRRVNPDWMRDEAGSLATLEGLRLGPDGEVVSYPAGFGLFWKTAAAAEFVHRTPEDAKSLQDRDARYYRFWIGRIVEMYRGSPTRLIFVPYPRGPVPLPARTPLPGAPDVRNLTPHSDNIVWLDDTMFADLERPIYYQDLQHLNRAGRKIFTERLGSKIASLLTR